MKRTSLALLAAVTVALSGCASMSGPKDIASTLASTPDLSTLNHLVVEAGLAETLAQPGPYTVFAPTDEAFKAVPKATIDALGRDKELLKSVLLYHVVPAKVMAADVTNGEVKTVQGAKLSTAKAGTFVTVDDAVVSKPDLPATNGVIHVVDKVLMPPKPKA